MYVCMYIYSYLYCPPLGTRQAQAGFFPIQTPRLGAVGGVNIYTYLCMYVYLYTYIICMYVCIYSYSYIVIYSFSYSSISLYMVI